MNLALFRTLYPKFSSVPDPVVENAITLSATYVGESFEDMAAEAVEMFVAHTCARWASDNATPVNTSDAFAITSKSVGSVSVSRSSALVEMGIDDHFKTTSYGARFCYLRDIAGMGALVTGGTVRDAGGSLSAPDPITLPYSKNFEPETV